LLLWQLLFKYGKPPDKIVATPTLPVRA